MKSSVFICFTFLIQVLALPSSLNLLPRGQCVSCGRGKSPSPQRQAPAQRQTPAAGSQTTNRASSARSDAAGQRQSKTPARGRESVSPRGSAGSSKAQGSPPSKQGRQASSRPSQASSSRSSEQGSSSQRRQDLSQPRDHANSNRRAKPKEPRTDWTTTRPPVRATVQMPGPGTIHFNHGTAAKGDYAPYKNLRMKTYKGPGPKDLKFSSREKMEVIASSNDGPVKISGEGGKASGGVLYPKSGGGHAIAQSKKDGRKELHAVSEDQTPFVSATAHPDETAKAYANTKTGGGAAWMMLSNSPDSTPPQSPRAQH